jgi:hypothetical protein
MNDGILIYGCEDWHEIQIKGKIFFNKRSGSPMIYDLSALLLYPDNSATDNPIPPSILCLIPPENLATAKSPVK